MEFIRLKKMPSREVLVKNYPPSKALLVLPGKEEDSYQPPHRLPHAGERKTTFGEMMRPKVLKKKGNEQYEYDLHCIGVTVVENDGVTFNQEKSETSFGQIYYFIGTGAYEQIVVPPIDPTLPPVIRNYIQNKYQAIANFLANPNLDNLLSPFDKKSLTRGQSERKEGEI